MEPRVDIDLSFSYMELPLFINTARTIEQFKRALKTWITNNIMNKT